MLKRSTAYILLALLCAATTACGSKVSKEAEFLQANLTQGAKSKVETKTTAGTSTTGNAIQIVTLSFLTNEDISDYRSKVNDLLIGRGYSQAMNLSTPNEFNIAYDGLEGRIHAEVLAEVALPPSGGMTDLPKEDLPKEPPSKAVEPPKEPLDGGKAPPKGIGAQGEAEKPSTPEGPMTPTDIHKITIKISY
jgi:hypothetical protein